MNFYADQANGFRPALKYIREKTGLNEKDISTIRKQLIDNGFIRYESGQVIELDWERIRLYSTLDKKMLPTKRGKARIAPPGSIPCGIISKSQPKIKQLLRQYKYTDSAPVRKLSPAEQRFFHKLEDMTEEQVNHLFGGGHMMELDNRHIYTSSEDQDYQYIRLPAERLPRSREPLPF